MKDFDIVHFYKSEEIFGKAAKIFEREKKILEGLIPNADIQHVGSCAIFGAISKFDVDIQIRVWQEQFEEAKNILENSYQPQHLELWMNEFALFESVDQNVDIDYMLTAIHGKYDDFSATRDFLIAHPEQLLEYNEMKIVCEGKPYHEYRTAKGIFLDKMRDEFLKK
ncbi:MAG: hypothetical protein JWM20_12 [Patescibacteria group bacterium]|nr:hypothetical protein [Patescibacteria group bacterium]